MRKIQVPRIDIAGVGPVRHTQTVIGNGVVVRSARGLGCLKLPFGDLRIHFAAGLEMTLVDLPSVNSETGMSVVRRAVVEVLGDEFGRGRNGCK